MRYKQTTAGKKLKGKITDKDSSCVTRVLFSPKSLIYINPVSFAMQWGTGIFNTHGASTDRDKQSKRKVRK